jgi:hypothetical protein
VAPTQTVTPTQTAAPTQAAVMLSVAESELRSMAQRLSVLAADRDQALNTLQTLQVQFQQETVQMEMSHRMQQQGWQVWARNLKSPLEHIPLPLICDGMWHCVCGSCLYNCLFFWIFLIGLLMSYLALLKTSTSTPLPLPLPLAFPSSCLIFLPQAIMQTVSTERDSLRTDHTATLQQLGQANQAIAELRHALSAATLVRDTQSAEKGAWEAALASAKADTVAAQTVWLLQSKQNSGSISDDVFVVCYLNNLDVFRFLFFYFSFAVSFPTTIVFHCCDVLGGF